MFKLFYHISVALNSSLGTTIFEATFLKLTFNLRVYNAHYAFDVVVVHAMVRGGSMVGQSGSVDPMNAG